MMRRILLAIFILLATVSQCFANNNFFIPGDAFFYFEIEQSEWENFRDGKLSTFDYDRPEHLPVMICGYAGFQKLDIAKLPAASLSFLII